MEKYMLLGCHEEKLPDGYQLLTVEEVLDHSKEITEFLAHDKNGSQDFEINGFELKEIFDVLKNKKGTASSSTREIEEEARAKDASTRFLVYHEDGSKNVAALEMEFNEKDNIEGIPNICKYPLETLVQEDLIERKESTFSISISDKKGTLNLKLYKVNTNDNEEYISNKDEDLFATDSDKYDNDDNDGEFDERSESFEENNTNKDMGMQDMIQIPNLSIHEEIPIGYKLVTIKELLLCFQNGIEVLINEKTIDKGKSSLFLIIRRLDTLREGEINDIQDFLGTYFSYECSPRYEHHKIRLKNGFIDKARLLVWKKFTRHYMYFQLAARCGTVKIESKVEDQVVALLFACLFDRQEEIDAITKVSNYFQILTMNDSNSIRGGCSLHLCAAEGKHKTLNLMLHKLETEERRRALAAKASQNEETPLYMAVLRGKWRVVELLCGREMEIDVNQTTKRRKDTALMIATILQMEEPRLWRPLLKRKDLRLDMVNEKGDNVFHMISYYEGWGLYSWLPATLLKELLERCGCKVSPKAFNAKGKEQIGEDVVAEVAALYNENAMHTFDEANNSHVINLPNHRNCTPLHAALDVRVVNDDPIVVETIPIQFSRLLISAGANIFATNMQGQNALHRACSSPKDSSTIEILLQCVLGMSLEDRESKFKDPKSRWKNYVCTQDLWGQTPLHLAAKYGNIEAIHLLLAPSKNKLIDCELVDRLIQMRDFNDQTILHHVATKLELFDVQDIEKKKLEIQEFVCRLENSGSALPLLAWSVAEGVGLADELARQSGFNNLSNALKSIREKSTENLLGLALSLKNYDMAVELLNRGAIMTKEMHDRMEEDLLSSLEKQQEYLESKVRCSKLEKGCLISFYKARQRQVQKKIEKLKTDKSGQNLKRLKVLQRIQEHQKGRTTDQPTHEDLLERGDIKSSISALLLNQHMGSPITLGILGSTGMGKSSMMLQVENYLLSKAARETLSLALLPSSMEPPTQNNFTGAKKESAKSKRRAIAILNKLQKMIPQIKREKNMFDQDQEAIDLRKDKEESIDWKACLFRYILKSLREIKTLLTSKLECKNLSTEDIVSKIEDCLSNFDEEDMWLVKRLALANDGAEVPNIMTIRFNAWQYQNRDEAWAGLAVEILKGMESCMTRARLFNASVMYSYKKNPSNTVVQLIIPAFVYLIIGGILAWVSFTLLSIHGNPILKKFGYASIPISALASIWKVLSQVFTYAKPISEKFIETTKSLQVEHLSKLGYQHRVIEDINFLKDRLTCAHIPLLWLWGFGAWIFNITSASTFLVDGVIASDALKFAPQRKKFRVIVFIDNLDRRKEKLFTPLNIILKACDINAVVAIDKESVEGVVDTEDEEATPSKDHEETVLLKDTLLQQLIQIPIVLPEPDVYDLRKHFLRAHLKDFQKNVNKEIDSHEKSSNNQFEDVPSMLQGPADNLIEVEDLNRVDKGEGDERILKKDNASSKNDEIQTISSGPHNSIEVGDCNEVNKGEGDEKSLKTDDISTNNDYTKILPSDEIDEEIEGAQNNKIWQEMKVNVLDSNYNRGEIKAFKHLVGHTYGYYRSPRAWKSLLNYHRLIRSLITYNYQHAYMSAWKPQLVIWVFVCWQWRQQMNAIFKNWQSLTAFPLEELEHENLLVDQKQLLDLKKVLKSESQAILLKQDQYKNLWESINAIYPTLLKAIEKHINENISTNKVQEKTTKKDKSLREEMETTQEMAEHTSNSSDLHEFKKESQNLPFEKQEKSKEEANLEWTRLFIALKKGRYDVSMQGIQIFQNFRFDCDPGSLKLHVK